MTQLPSLSPGMNTVVPLTLDDAGQVMPPIGSQQTCVVEGQFFRMPKCMCWLLPRPVLPRYPIT